MEVELVRTPINLHGGCGIVPEGAVYVGDRVYRGPWRLERSRWYNPYKPDLPGKPRDGTREEVITKYRAYLLGTPELMAALAELRGKDLACWCAPKPCHADVLLELADR